MYDPDFATRWGGPWMSIRIDPAVAKAARARFLSYFPAASWTKGNPCARLEVEEDQTMFNAIIHADGRQFAVTTHGPFDATNWDYAKVDMNLDDEAAFVGCGRTARSAVENCVRTLVGTPYEGYRKALEREAQHALETFVGSDVVQGDGHMKLYCVIKAKK